MKKMLLLQSSDDKVCPIILPRRPNHNFETSNCDLCLISPYQWFIAQLADQPLWFGPSPLSIRPLTSTKWFKCRWLVVCTKFKDKSYSNGLAVCWFLIGLNWANLQQRVLYLLSKIVHICNVHAFSCNDATYNGIQCHFTV